ncbi:unnamed protein product [Mytilus coruscus]|uniref:RNase H type-1 domain-containing protein n=1 Tax=Mytilus coruscus TaxID=42192 RepID=A0A6J8CX95_MYTCO|nr:unnamed protein product [Mytilus coruscus]
MTDSELDLDETEFTETRDKSILALRSAAESTKRKNKSEGGCRTVNEYLSHEVASDSEDEKRIRALDNRTVKKIKAGKTDKRSSRKRPAEASDGYKNLLLHEPKEIFLRNNKSALDNSEFVSTAITDLMKGSLIRKVSSRPHVVNPLTVSTAKNKHSSRKVKVRLLAKVAGKIISFTPALGHITQIMSRDESNTAAAGYIDNLEQIIHKSWSDDEKLKSSTWREVKAKELSILSFARLLKKCTVSFYTDNQNAVTIVHTGSKVPELQSLALSIYKYCRKNEITIFVNWIPREHNQQADMLSRIVGIDDRRISDEFFTFLNDLWGPFSVDRFASFDNTKLPKFNSLYWNPGSLCVDIFTCDWSGENNWLVPPVTEASRVINHLVKYQAKGTLIVPN